MAVPAPSQIPPAVPNSDLVVAVVLVVLPAAAPDRRLPRPRSCRPCHRWWTW